MNYAQILKDDITNGDGYRVSLWVTGCPHKCKGCHNSELWDYKAGKRFGRRELTVLLDLLRDKDKPVNLSILGGEPLSPYNRGMIEFVCKQVKSRVPEKTIWLWTGYNYEEVKHLEIMKYLDVVIDGKYEEDKKYGDLLWRGSTNQRRINVKTGELF